MRTTPPKNLPVDLSPSKKTTLAITPGRRAIGIALADGLGVDRIWLFRLQGAEFNEALFCTIRLWLEEAIHYAQVKVIVLEKLSSKRATKTNQMLTDLLADKLKDLGFSNIQYQTRKEAIDWVCRHSQNSEEEWQGRTTLRQAAEIISVYCRELQFRPPPIIACRTDWDRTWGQVVAAAALALYSQKNN